MAVNRARNWNLVLNGETLPKPNEIIAKLAEIRAKNYAFIYHNKDTHKREHIHLVIEFENARTFDALKKKLNGWHIEPCKSLASSIQYLTHKNATEKEQYELDDVIKSNDNWFDTYWNLGQNCYVNDEKELIRDIMQGKYHNILEIVLSDKYSMEWLQRRWKIVEEVFFWLNKEPWKYEKDITD